MYKYYTWDLRIALLSILHVCVIGTQDLSKIITYRLIIPQNDRHLISKNMYLYFCLPCAWARPLHHVSNFQLLSFFPRILFLIITPTVSNPLPKLCKTSILLSKILLTTPTNFFRRDAALCPPAYIQTFTCLHSHTFLPLCCALIVEKNYLIYWFKR